MNGWIQITSDRFEAAVPHGRAFGKGGCTAIVSIDEGRWHLSIARRDRLPTWEELGDARDSLLPPDLFFCVPHPPRSYWINIHEYCLHLYEIRDNVLVRMWAEEGAAYRKHLSNTTKE